MRTVRNLICVLAIGSTSACETVDTAVDQVFPPTAATSAAQCTRTLPPGRQIGAALVDSDDGPVLAFAGGKNASVSIGGTESSLNDKSAADLGLDIGATDLRLQEISTASGRARLMLGSPTRRRVLSDEGPVTLDGQAAIELRAADNLTERVTDAALAIDPAAASAILTLPSLAKEATDPVASVEWRAISYCDGQLLSQGAGRFRLTASSGRATRPFGPSTDGPDGSGVLSGFVYGPDSPDTAALAFAIVGANGSLSGIATFPWLPQ